jgi:lipopolysaccharide biosynthesis glycosyltransferase
MPNKNVIVTLEIPAVDNRDTHYAIDRYNDCFRIARLKYVEKIGCDYISIREYAPGLPRIAVWQKFSCYQIMKDQGYEKLLFLDADILVTPDAPNVFEIVNSGVGLVMDYWQPNPGALEVKKRRDFDFNNGFMLCCKDALEFLDINTHIEILDGFKRCCGWRDPSNPGAIAEQDYFRHKLKKSRIEITQLSELWNYQVWYNDYSREVPSVAEIRMKSNMSRFDAYMIHYTILKDILPYIDFGILYLGRVSKRLMWEDITKLHQLIKIY